MTNNQHPKTLIYEDQYVKLNHQAIKISIFYFPTQKNISQILLTQIQKVTLKQMDPMDSILGVDEQYFIDFNKKKQSKQNFYIELQIQNQSQMISFIVQSPQKLIKMIEQQVQEIKNRDKIKTVKQTKQKQNNLYQNIQINQKTIQNALSQLESFQTQHVFEKQCQKQNKEIKENQKQSEIKQNQNQSKYQENQKQPENQDQITEEQQNKLSPQ